MSDVLASLAVRLGAETADFNRKMAAAKKELLSFVRTGETLKGAGEGLSKYVTLPLVAFGALSVKAGGDFQAGMNRVEAATGAAGAELEALKGKAQGIALDPKLKFSAGEAAGALEALAKNGLSTADILGGAADAAVNLATATGGKLATSADITTDVMNNFGKSAKDAAGLVDNITGTTLASKLSIDEYRLALGQAAGVAGPLGVQFEEFNTALAVTSSGFSSGSDAGTSFKTFLQRLVPQSKEAKAAMEQLGLEFFDAQGKMKPLRVIAGDLQKAFKDLTDQQKSELGTKIFGADSIRTALLLAKDGSEGFDRMAASIGKVNAAAQGETLSKGFTGALEGFKSSLEGTEIAIAESGLLDFGTNLLKSGSQALTTISKLSPETLRFGTILAGLAAGVGPVLAGVGALGVALPAIEVGFALLTGPVGLVALGVTALGIGFAAVAANSEDATTAFQKQKGTVEALEKGVVPLLNRYDELKGKSTLNAAEQEELRAIIQKVGEQIPTAISAFDSYGKAIDISSDAARRHIQLEREILAVKNKDALKERREEYKRLTAEIERSTAALRQRDAEGNITREETSLVKVGQDYETITRVVKLTGAEVSALQVKLADQRAARRGVGGLIDELKGIPPVAAEAAKALDKVVAPPVTKGTTSALTDEQSKALAKLRAELKQTQDEVAAGINFDPLAADISTLVKGIPDLLAVGFKPQGPLVKGFVAKLHELETEYDKFKARIAEKQAGDALLGTPIDKTPKPSGPPETLLLAPFDTSALSASVQRTHEIYASLSAAEKESLANHTEFTARMQELIERFPTQALSDIGTAVGNALGTGDNVLQAAGAAILKTLADFGKQYGEQLLLLGAADIALGLIPKGGAEIAAGIALIGGSVALGAFAANSSKGASVGSVGSGFTPGNASPARVPEQRIKIELEPVTFRQKGPDLSAVVSVTAYRRLRTS